MPPFGLIGVGDEHRQSGHMHINDWPTDERPREKLLARGAAVLSDAELLAIFVGSGLRGQDAVRTARDLLHRHGPLRCLLDRPAKALARWPQKVQEAIRTARVRVGMTREQVIMALGYPVSSENPALDTDAWRYWLGSFEEYQVHFNAAGKVREVSGAPGTLARVLMR